MYKGVVIVYFVAVNEIATPLLQFRHIVEGGVAGNVKVDIPKMGSRQMYYGEYTPTPPVPSTLYTCASVLEGHFYVVIHTHTRAHSQITI